MPVMEKLWKAACVVHAGDSLGADLWVLERTLRILSGHVGQVVEGFRQSVTKRRLSGAPPKTLQAAAAYFSLGARQDSSSCRSKIPPPGSLHHVIQTRLQ